MKLLPVYLFSVCVLNFCVSTYGQERSNKVLVFGIIRNYSTVIEIADKDYTEPFQVSNAERSFVPDSGGRFSVEFTLNEPKYFSIARNVIYLCPGDKLRADIDYQNAENSSFSGSHSSENEYLKTCPYPKAGSFLQGGQHIKATLQQTFDLLSDLAEERETQLSGYTNLSSEFRFLEQNRVYADLLNSIYAVRSYWPDVHKLTGDSLIAFNSRFAYCSTDNNFGGKKSCD